MIITIHVKPNSRSNELLYVDNMVKVKITAAPESGKANSYLIKFLAAFFQTSQQNIEILRGHKSRVKSVKIDLPDEDVVKKLGQQPKET